MKKHLLLISLLLFLGCEKQLEEYQPEPNIFCLLRTDKDTTIALVGMSIGFSDTLRNPEKWNGISDASVKIDYGNGEVQLSGIEDSVGFYKTDSLKITAGKTYQIEIKYPDGKLVKGSTIVPDSFSITNVEKIDTITDSFFGGDMVQITLAWEQSQNAKDYQMVGESYYRSENDSTSYYARLTTDSNIDSLSFPIEMQGWDSLIGFYPLNLVEVKINIWALDENYSDYVRQPTWWGVFEEGIDPTSYMHLAGGIGVFGSVYICQERRIAFFR